MLSNGSTRLTVVMSVKNGEPYVAEAVQSILNQTYHDFRFIIVDNASTDSTRDTIQNLNDPRIDLICLPQDVGQTRALNLGLDRVQTEYVARMDADDVALPTRFAVQVAFLDTHPDVVAVGAAAQMIDWNGKDLFVIRYPSGHDAILDAFPFANPIIHPVVMMRTEAVFKAGKYSEKLSYAQDVGLWLSLSSVGNLANIPIVLIRARLHLGQQTRDSAKRRHRLEDAIVLCNRMKNIRGMSKVFYAALDLRLFYYRYVFEENFSFASEIIVVLKNNLIVMMSSCVVLRSIWCLFLSFYRKCRVSLRKK